ncbi:hypothetical protein LCGC14_0802910 [marine sediment metagenome]|uniref:ArnR1-like winged helix-turn-helix domain-containing protein n=1 Tax=marine sediment metagenome TaxID=412755 RepID=A0A0F9S920_9ZZZZ
MDFFLNSVKDTLDAINKLIESNVNVVNTKRVRRCLNIKSSDRSKINFIWRSLKFLEEQGILSPNGITNPKTYKILSDQKIGVDTFISQIRKGKKRLP